MLGSLVEKQLTTPQQYPLTLNALVSATNQTTNRDPVVTLEDDAVLAALDELRSHHLIRVVLPSHGRSVKRYRHVLDEVYGLDAPRYALLSTLLLRGPQTLGELRARSERMAEFPSVDDVQDQMAALAEHSDGLARLLPRRPGQKEDRWQQIVAEPWGNGAGSAEGDGAGADRNTDATGGEVGVGSTVATVRAPVPNSDLRLEFETLRSEVALLRSEMADLRADLDALQHELGS